MGVSYFTFNKSQQGSNHVKVDKVCEDWSGSYSDGEISICVVADGHGSDNYPRTDRGSRFAVQASMNCVREFLKDITAEDILGRQQEEIVSQLERSILNAWYSLVEDDYANEEISDEELKNVSEKYRNRYLSKTYLEKAYGTTLIVFAITEHFCIGIQIGDGTCVVLDREGNFSVPIPADPDCQLNVTTSICDSDAISEFRYYVFETAPVAVFCGSDGIEDSYSNIEEVFAFYRSISTIFAEHGSEVGEEEVSNYLPVLTQRGSGDDVSIAGIINMNAIAPMKALFELQGNLFKATDELDAKQNRLRIVQERFETLRERFLKFANGDKSVTFTHKMADEFTAKRDEITTLMQDIHDLSITKTNIEENLRSFLSQEYVDTSQPSGEQEPSEEINVVGNAIDDATIAVAENIHEGQTEEESKMIVESATTDEEDDQLTHVETSSKVAQEDSDGNASSEMYDGSNAVARDDTETATVDADNPDEKGEQVGCKEDSPEQAGDISGQN